MKVLVTGGGGFLGGAVVRLLHTRGDVVRSFTRSNYPWLAEIGVEQVLGDLTDADAVKKAAEGCDAVLHVAAKAGVWGRYEDYVGTNVTGTQNVLAACRAHGIRKLVFTGTPSAVHTGGDVEGANESLRSRRISSRTTRKRRRRRRNSSSPRTGPTSRPSRSARISSGAPATRTWCRGSSPGPERASCAASGSGT
jgi:nucleoside-diphosphate-sugar epimerase